MTTSQLLHWSSQNREPDQWWLCLDTVTEEVPVTVAEIEERLKSGSYSTIQALNVSKAGMKNPPWTEITMPPPISAPLVIQPAHAGSNPASERDQSSTSSKSPWFWVLWMLAGGLLVAVFCNVSMLMLFVLTWIVIGLISHQLFKESPVFAVPVSLVASLLTLMVFAKIRTVFGVEYDPPNHSVGKSTSSAATMSGEHTISGDSVTGFSHLEDEERATELASDTAAFKQFLLAGVMSKRATIFKKGETVILEDTDGLLSSKVKLRRKGETVSYWTNREAID